MRPLGRGIAIGLLVGLTAGQARAFDLTGTWKGKQICKTTGTDGTTKFTEKDDTLTITQIGTEVRIHEAAFNSLNTGLAFAFTANPDKGAVAFRECGLSENTATKGEMGNAKVTTKPSTGDGKFVAVVVFTDSTLVDTCKWRYKRTSTADPGVAACPQ
jgi:hypothetical protein